MEALFGRMVLGHLVGDYLLQSKKMALDKTAKGRLGLARCTVHSLLYTLAIGLFLWPLPVWALAFVLTSHWIIDRFSLAQRWLDLIGGRNFLTAYRSTELYREIDLAFSCLVYAVADGTWHLLILWFIVNRL